MLLYQYAGIAFLGYPGILLSMKIITVTGYKGGIGKSTTAVHLAAYFSDFGSTLLIDSDPNRSALKTWNREGKLPFKVVDERQAISAIAGNDWVIIDTPARPESEDLKELAKGCALLILPTAPDVLCLDPALETAKDIGEANYKFLVTVVPPKPSKEGDEFIAALQDAGLPVFQQTIRRSAGFAKAAKQGVSIRNVKPSSLRLAWQDYKTLGDEIRHEL